MNRYWLAATLAMVAFAANSILCRLALRGTAIDPATFTWVRLLTGAATLWLLVRMSRGGLRGAGTWGSAMALVGYAITFSFAYVGMTTGTGALLLFGSVQLIMIGAGLLGGERVGWKTAAGWTVAVSGVVLLVWPGVAAPPLREAALMFCAGVGWGIYSLRGRKSSDALRDTAGNFVLAIPGAIVIGIVFWSQRSWDPAGAGLAALSGAVASGLGYAAWYTALPRMSAIAASNTQLSVPVIAAFGGVVVSGESITLRLIVSSFLVLGGIALAIRQSKRPA